jgi:tricarballylate dehydrogenase
MPTDTLTCDIAVLGGGNAALCAALTARETGADVIVVECAPKSFRGGNSRHTRNLRCMHGAPTDLLTDAYAEDEYYTDLLRVTGGETNERLARLAIRESAACPAWMQARGVRFQPPLRGTLHLGRTNAFFLGGGKALINSYYARAERLGIRILYDASVADLDLVDGTFHSAALTVGGAPVTLRARAVVVASGGFESNLEWLREAWGPAADNFIIRGTPFNTGVVLKRLLERGAKKIGDATQCHAVAIDARAPKFDGGIVTRLDCVSLGRSATPSGGGSSRSSPARSRTASWTRRRSAASCRRCSHRSSRRQSPSWLRSSNRIQASCSRPSPRSMPR